MREAAFQYGTRENETLEIDLKYLEILSVVIIFFLLTFVLKNYKPLKSCKNSRISTLILLPEVYQSFLPHLLSL